MKFSFKKSISKVVLTGLIVQLLPVAVYAKKDAAMQGRLSRVQVDRYIKQIHNTSTIFETIANKFKVGGDKVKNAVDEFIAVLGGKKKKMSKESENILGSSAVVGGAATAAGTAGVVGAGVVVTAAVLKASKEAAEKAGELARKKTLLDIAVINKTVINQRRLDIKAKIVEKLKDGIRSLKNNDVVLEQFTPLNNLKALDWNPGKLKTGKIIDLGEGLKIEKHFKPFFEKIAKSKDKQNFDEFVKTFKEQAIMSGGFESRGGQAYTDHLSADVLSKAKKISASKEVMRSLSTVKSYILPALLISGGVHIFLLPAYLISLGLTAVTVSGILAAVYGGAIGISALHVKRLEKEEQRFPGTLTDSDRGVIKKFKNVVKGPIVRALIKGKQIKAARRNIVKEIFEENKDFFIGKFGTKKRAQKDIEKYLLAKLRIPGLGKTLYPMNLNIRWYNYLKYTDIKDTWKVINEYKKLKKGLNQDERNELMREQIGYMKRLYDNMSTTKRLLKRLTPGFNLLNAKELALKIVPSYAMNQNALNSDLKTVRNLEAKYGSKLANKIEQPLEDYKKKQSEIIMSLSVE